MSELSVGQLRGLTVNNNVITVPSGHKLYAPGSIVQVIYETSGFVNQTINSATPVALTGLSATITPKFSNSAILIEGVVSASWSYVSSMHVFKNGVDLVPNHGGNTQSGGATALWTHYQSSQESDRGNQLFPFSVLYRDTPNTTSAITYDFRANSGWSGAAQLFYLNNRSSPDMLSSSYIKLTEIAQ
jgi:hypothetical protein